MLEHDFIPVSDEYYDVLVDAKFVQNLTPSDVANILKIVLGVGDSKAARGTFFVGFAALEVSLEKVKVQFRFSKRREDIASLDAPQRDELPRKIARFTWHLFARVDDSYSLGYVSLPDGFRAYIDLDE